MGYLLNGTDNYIAFPNASPTPPYLPDGDESRSVSFWYRPGIIEGERDIVSWGTDAPNSAFSITSLSGAATKLSVWGYLHDHYGALTLERDVLYHVVVTYNSATGKLRSWVNGILDIDIATTDYATSTTGYFNIGLVPVFGKYGKGVIHDVKIYNRALTEAEVFTLYGKYYAFDYLKSLTVTQYPNFGIYAAGYVFISGWGGGSISKISPITQTVLGTSISFGSNVSGMAYDGVDVWLAVYGANTIRAMNPDTLALGDTITGFSGPVGICAYNAKLWVANYGNGTISKVDVATRTVEASYGGFTGPQAIYEFGGFLYVLNLDGTTISKVNPATGAIVGTITGLSGPGQMVLHDDFYFVTNYINGSVAKISVATETVVKTVMGFTTPWGLATDGTHIIVMGEDSYQLRIIDPETLDLVGYSADRYIKGPAVVVGDYIFIGSTDTTMFVFQKGDLIHNNPSDITEGKVFDAVYGEASGACIDSVGGNNGTVNGTTTSFYHPRPTITSESDTAQTGENYDYTIQATTDIIEYNVVGLPVGVNVNRDAGNLYGIPEETGTFSIGLLAANYYGFSIGTLTLIVSTLLNGSFLKRSLLRVRTAVAFKLNLGTSLATEIDITKYVLNIGDVAEKLSKSNVNVGGVLLPKLSIVLDNSRGKWNKGGEFFKNGFINNSLFSLETSYIFNDAAVLPSYKFVGLTKYISCSWDRVKHTLEVDIIHASNLLATEKIAPGILSHTTFKNVCYTILNRQPFTKYMTISLANFTMGWDVAAIDSYADMTNKKVKDVLDDIMLLTGSVYYVDYDQNFIIEPAEPTTATAVCNYRGQDIINVASEKYDWKGQYTAIKWDDETNPVQRVEMPFSDRELYQYDFIELVLNQKYITDTANRAIILSNLLTLYKYVKREVVITCKWNPEIIVNKYISLDVPEESIIGDDFLIWNDNQWNDGKYWGIAQPGISFLSTDLWRVLDIKRNAQGKKMQLTLVQLYSDDEV